MDLSAKYLFFICDGVCITLANFLLIFFSIHFDGIILTKIWLEISNDLYGASKLEKGYSVLGSFCQHVEVVS